MGFAKQAGKIELDQGFWFILAMIRPILFAKVTNPHGICEKQLLPEPVPGDDIGSALPAVRQSGPNVSEGAGMRPPDTVPPEL